MLPVLSHRQMKQVDAATVERCGITSFQLMENAARSVHEFISDLFDGELKGKKATVFCGSGNNGGDGAAVARMLCESGMSVSVIASGWGDSKEGDARINFDSVRSLASSGRLRLMEFDGVIDTEKIEESITTSDVLVDGIFGTGLSRPIEESFQKIFSLINNRNETSRRIITCIAIDIPSGLFADSAKLTEHHVSADYTIAFTSPKLANVMSPARNANGSLLICDIGTPTALIEEQHATTFVSASNDVDRWMASTAFSTDSYKKTRGHVVCVTGSVGYEGAAVLSANSAMMSGAGIVTLLTPESARIPIASRVTPEVMVRGFVVGESSHPMLSEACARADAILVGCGIGITESNREMLKMLLDGATSPIVIDADALTLLSPFDECVSADARLVLTPHEGEFKRLFGCDAGKGEERLENVRRISMKHGVILVMKGESVLIGFPDGRVVINPTGNSALGKAGNGDNLAGIIAGFIAQSKAAGASIKDAVISAVYIAGLAGDIARERFGDRVMVASDVRDSLSDAFRYVEVSR